VKASTGRTIPLMARLSMPIEVEKHIDSEIQSVVLLCECEIKALTTIVCFL
jgi:hypothetical protein